jgi:hypothetical protein
MIFNYPLHHFADQDGTIREARRVGKNIRICESCAFDTVPLHYLSNLYWKIVDGATSTGACATGRPSST